MSTLAAQSVLEFAALDEGAVVSDKTPEEIKSQSFENDPETWVTEHGDYLYRYAYINYYM